MPPAIPEDRAVDRTAPRFIKFTALPPVRPPARQADGPTTVLGQGYVLGALSEKLEGVLGRLKGRGVLTEAHIDEALREVRLALLEADVHYAVVKRFVEDVRARAPPGAEARAVDRSALGFIHFTALLPLRSPGRDPAPARFRHGTGTGLKDTCSARCLKSSKGSSPG